MPEVVTRGAGNGSLVSNIVVLKADPASLKGNQSLFGRRRSPLEADTLALMNTDASAAVSADDAVIAFSTQQLTSDPRVLVAIAAKQGVSV